MKVELLLNDCNGQVLPIFEGNRGDSSQFKLCKSKNLITQYPRARRAPRVATVHDAVKESGRVLPRPSVVFHTYASVVTSWVARTLSYCTHVKRDKVSSNSATYETTKFVGLHISHMHQYIIKLAHRGQTICP
jgi:hypothetical protein